MNTEHCLNLIKALIANNYIREPKEIIQNLYLSSPLLSCFELDIEITYSVCEMMINNIISKSECNLVDKQVFGSCLDSYNLLM